MNVLSNGPRVSELKVEGNVVVDAPALDQIDRRLLEATEGMAAICHRLRGISERLHGPTPPADMDPAISTAAPGVLGSLAERCDVLDAWRGEILSVIAGLERV